ncbi:hypothetical protein CCB80_00050 [Armatimonadetes bacterium Uphvl-Ar1]|nr:hypothetical protein CCB80_00050 [Armatimonadetes bacterium Uphvl-Ar1]
MVDVYVRGGNGRGREFRNAIYRSMGIVEIDDFAAGAMALRKMAWADTSRVGIYGTSYGGYSSAMSVLRYPELFHAGSASSMVSDWRFMTRLILSGIWIYWKRTWRVMIAGVA